MLQTTDDFFVAFEEVCANDSVDIMLKKTDKKKERQAVLGHKHTLIAQLENEPDPAMALHLACTILFSVFTQCAIHTPGRCVPHVIAHIRPHLSEESQNLLTTCHGSYDYS